MNARTTDEKRIATQRFAEVAEILAAGILPPAVPATRHPRGDREQVRLDFSPGRSVHADRLRPRRTAP